MLLACLGVDFRSVLSDYRPQTEVKAQAPRPVLLGTDVYTTVAELKRH